MLGDPDGAEAAGGDRASAGARRRDGLSEAASRPGREDRRLDIPLLFETGGRDRVDKVVVVTAPAEVQRERVLSRPGMTAEKFEAILAKQVPDAEKRRLADYVIDTSQGMEPARQAVAAIIAELRGRKGA